MAQGWEAVVKITLSGNLLRIEWPVYSSEIEQEILRRLNTVPGIEAGNGRCAYAPVIQLQRLMFLFEKASYDYRAIQEADNLAWRFYESLTRMGIKLELDESGYPVAVGENVSPLVAQLVAERSHALKPFVQGAMYVDKIKTLLSAPPPVSIPNLYPRVTKRRAKRKVK